MHSAAASQAAEALRQKDPDVECVVVTSDFVVAYVMSVEGTDPGWRKANVEGPVYLVRRRTAPRYQLIVKGKYENQPVLCDGLHRDWELDCQQNYIFYKVEDASKRIRGLWFSEDSERQRVESMLEQALQDMRKDAPRQTPPGGGGAEPQGEPQGEPPPRAQNNHPAATVASMPSRVPAADRDRRTEVDFGLNASTATVRAALHAMADDDEFVAMFMEKLRTR